MFQGFLLSLVANIERREKSKTQGKYENFFNEAYKIKITHFCWP